MNWLIPHPLPPPHPDNKTSPFCVFLYVAIGLVYWGEREGEGCWEGAKSYDGEKAWSSINIQYYMGEDVPAVDGFSETEDQSLQQSRDRQSAGEKVHGGVIC
jgi:hypothetical protein